MPEGPRAGFRVLQLIAPAPFGGAESVVAGLAASWRQRGGGGVAALMAGQKSSRLVGALRAASVPVWEVQGGTRGYRSEVRQVRDIVGRERVDIVHTHVYRANAVGFFAARPAGVPVVATVHGFTGGDWKNQVYEWFDRRLLRRFAAVACVSPALVMRLRAAGIRSERLRLVPNVPGARAPLSREEARRALGLPAEGHVVGWVGRLSPEKAPERFLAMMNLLGDACIGVVVGDGPLRGKLEQLTRLTRSSRVLLTGARDEADRLLTAFDALVLSSQREASPMVVLEAMRAGVPVVSFAVGGIPDLLADTGWLVEASDVPALAAATASVLQAPREAARRAGLARARVNERYGEAQWLDAYHDLYRLATGLSG